MQEYFLGERTRHQSDVSVQDDLTIHAGWTRASRQADCAANRYDVRSERGSETRYWNRQTGRENQLGFGEDQANEGPRINIQPRVPTRRSEVAIGRWSDWQGLMTNTRCEESEDG